MRAVWTNISQNVGACRPTDVLYLHSIEVKNYIYSIVVKTKFLEFKSLNLRT